MVDRGRPIRYAQPDKEAILAEYEGAGRGDRGIIAARLGISPRSLRVYISRWRRQIKDQAALEADLPF